jgi:hypothetical protein
MACLSIHLEPEGELSMTSTLSRISIVGCLTLGVLAGAPVIAQADTFYEITSTEIGPDGATVRLRTTSTENGRAAYKDLYLHAGPHGAEARQITSEASTE